MAAAPRQPGQRPQGAAASRGPARAVAAWRLRRTGERSTRVVRRLSHGDSCGPSRWGRCVPQRLSWRAAGRRPGGLGAAAPALAAAGSEPARLFAEDAAAPPPGLAAAGLGPRSEWRLCAAVEGRPCHCVGTAAFHSWTGDWAMVRHVNGSIPCTADAFGDDPRPHFAKLCSCRQGPGWPEKVAQGFNKTVARTLVPRVEIGAAGAGCSPEHDGEWTPCAVVSTRYDASLVPDRLLPRLPPEEQCDAALRKLDVCHRIAGPDRALRVLGVLPGVAEREQALSMLKANSVPICAVVFSPAVGPTWDGRAAVFCPTNPPSCLQDWWCVCRIACMAKFGSPQAIVLTVSWQAGYYAGGCVHRPCCSN
ncbi:unnamed protein product [Prorocentrum cordatum]|uniref:Alpha-1,6-mannosyl-glycoprotein 6-beta-N-acetylglucosaminyltransferase n=1 Tax=Prorocentrum cordatum TaxID=2364126 RepID=A0ABN9TA57_9DINO|nr:unnamed protein product [Polarella glacialis]